MNEQGSVESKVEVVESWERMNEIWSEVKGTIGPEVEVVDNWERLNEIWPRGKGNVESKVEVVDNRERMNGIWSEAKGTAGEKSVSVGDSACAALFQTNISDEESEVSGSDEEDKSWISWFCGLRGNKFLCQVDDDFILDEFNLSGLSNQVPYYDHALDLILDEESSSHGEIITEEQNELIESAAEVLYGMIHARYLLTSQGLGSMFNKYYKHDFGSCPRVDCRGQHCLPIGLSDIPRASTVKIYCPKCEDVYDLPSKYQASNIDGAYFGTTFPHLFLMTYEGMRPEKVSQSYVPRLFGFKLHNQRSLKQDINASEKHSGRSTRTIDNQEKEFKIQDMSEVFVPRMRHLRRKTEKKKKKKNNSDSESESEGFTSDSSDEEMKIAKEQVKRLMEKAVAIPENGDAMKIEDSKAEIEDSKAKIEDSKAEEEEETMFPRRRGRFIRYLRRQRSESQDSVAFQIRENMTKTLTSEESFMSYSDDSVE